MVRNSSRAGSALAVGSITIGGLLLLGQVLGLQLQPGLSGLVMLAAGLACLAALLFSRTQGALLAVGGMILSAAGSLLLYQSAIGRWDSWSYLWTIIPIAAGAGLIVHGAREGRPAAIAHGRRLIGISLVLLLLGAVWFTLILPPGGFAAGLLGAALPFGSNASWPFYVIVPALLLLLGVAMYGALAAPAAIFAAAGVATGLVLLFQNSTGNWLSWTYAWGLVVAAVGAATALVGLWVKRSSWRVFGERMAALGLLAFGVGGTIVELLLGVNGGLGRLIWALLLGVAAALAVAWYPRLQGGTDR